MRIRYGVRPMTLDHDPHAGHDEPELLDRIDALRVLRADSPEEKGRLLEEIGGSGKVEQEIVSQLSKVSQSKRFGAARGTSTNGTSSSSSV